MLAVVVIVVAVGCHPRNPIRWRELRAPALWVHAVVCTSHRDAVGDGLVPQPTVGSVLGVLLRCRRHWLAKVGALEAVTLLLPPTTVDTTQSVSLPPALTSTLSHFSGRKHTL